MLNVKNQLLKIDQKLFQFEQTFIDHSSKIGFVNNEVTDLKRDYENYRDITIKLNDHAVMTNDYLNDAKLMNEDITHIRVGLEDLCSNLMTTDNYLDKYLPFRIQNFISETLENVLPQVQLEKLVRFDKAKYKHMHENIIKDDGISNLDKMKLDNKEIEIESKIQDPIDEPSEIKKNDKRVMRQPLNKQETMFSGDPSSKIQNKASKLKDVLIMAKNTPYQYFKEIDSATIKKKHKGSSTSSIKQNSASIYVSKGKFLCFIKQILTRS